MPGLSSERSLVVESCAYNDDVVLVNTSRSLDKHGGTNKKSGKRRALGVAHGCRRFAKFRGGAEAVSRDISCWRMTGIVGPGAL